MYEAVRVTSEVSTTPARFAARAAQLGYGGIVIHGSIDANDATKLEETYGIDVARGVVIDAEDRDVAAREIADARADVDVLTVWTENAELRQFLARRRAIDVLRPGPEIAHTTAKVARDHGIALAFDLGPILRDGGQSRVTRLRTLRRLATIVAHFDVPHVVTASAKSHLDLRAPRELASLAGAIEQDESFLEAGLERWGCLIARARRNRDDRFIEPGVQRVDDEADAR